MGDGYDSQEKIYSESEIFNMLAALQQASSAVPWYLRWTMRGWEAAIGAISSALCSNHARRLMRDESARQLLN